MVSGFIVGSDWPKNTRRWLVRLPVNLSIFSSLISGPRRRKPSQPARHLHMVVSLFAHLTSYFLPKNTALNRHVSPFIRETNDDNKKKQKTHMHVFYRQFLVTRYFFSSSSKRSCLMSHFVSHHRHRTHRSPLGVFVEAPWAWQARGWRQVQARCGR